MPDKHTLFVYGTIGDPEIFELLLGRSPVYLDGKLHHYKVFVHVENGYLFVRPHQGNTVNGKVVELSSRELKIIDLWEDVPLYQRELLTIETKKGMIQAYVYTQNNTSGKSIEENSRKTQIQIKEDIKEFTEWLKNNFKE